MTTVTQAEGVSKVTLDEFLAALFPDRNETVCLATFQAKGAPSGYTRPARWDATRADLMTDETQRQVSQLNEQNGIYFIVNSGGQKDEEITRYNAFFVERDSGSLAEQHAMLDAAPVQTSARLETFKSVHAYWLIEGDCTEEEWREIQARLIAYFDGDKQNKNPSRCMRLPHFNHVTYNGKDVPLSYKLVELVQFDPARRYTVAQMQAAFPPVVEKQTDKAEPEKPTMGEPVDLAISSDSQFEDWTELHEEVRRRLNAMRPISYSSDGQWAHLKGICHGGRGDTAVFLNLESGAYGCHKGCEPSAIRLALGLPEQPLSSSKSSDSQVRFEEHDLTINAARPKLDRQKALYGLAGDIVRAIEPHSEADPAALLVQLLVAFGSIIGRSAHFTAEADRHYTNLFAVIVGDSSRGRKGSSLSHIRRLMEDVDDGWAGCIVGGLSSGEGLVHHVRDEDDGFMPGAIRESKRAMVIESEFASVLNVQNRNKSTLSTTIRQAWDSGHLSVMRRNNPDRATNAHISIIGHITREELNHCLHSTDMVNGYANRFLWVYALRSKKLPDGGNFNQANTAPLVLRLRAAVEFARHVGEMKRDAEASELWRKIYDRLDEEIPSGRLGATLNRAEAQIMRLACVYALLDCSNVVKRVHLEAAKAVFDYCAASSRYTFGGHLLGKKARKFLDALLAAGTKGKSKSEIYELNGNHTKDVNEALAELKDAGLARVEFTPTAGRAEERWFAIAESNLQECEDDDFDEQRVMRPDETDLKSSNSLNSSEASEDTQPTEAAPPPVITTPIGIRLPPMELFGPESHSA